LERLEEIDFEGGVKVEVTLSAQMIRVDTGDTVWTNSVSKVGNVEKRDVSAVVSAMSDTMDRAMQELFAALPGETEGSGVPKGN
jgi:ABC-type uncharacterized transport system auxiliary subunit